MKLKAGGKALIVAAAVGSAGWYANRAGYFEGKQSVASSTPSGIDIPTSDVAATPPTSIAGLDRSPQPAHIKVLTIAWNAMAGLSYANGGPTTSAGSLMDKHGLKVEIERQDDYSQMIAQHAAFAKSFAAGNPNPTEGTAFSIIMGDGYPGFAAAAAEAMGKTGQSLQVVGSLGYSRGEDKCMLPAEVKSDPQKARGQLVAAVPRDGDAHICFKWASDNGVPINPDAKTYDQDAINFVEVSAFTDADEKLIAGYSEDRRVVSHGRLTGETKRVRVTGTATWTPGDVKVVGECSKAGSPCHGISSVASTKEYRWQMPAVVIGNREWMAKNPLVVQNFLAAAFEGGELVRSDAAALKRAGEIQAKIFKEQDGSYWSTYFKGTTVNGVHLGGSTTNGLGDNAFLFGLNGNDNLYKRVYTVFGNIDKAYYPKDMPSVVPYESVVDTSYVEALLKRATSPVRAEPQAYSQTVPVTTFAKKSYSIEFDTGKTSFTPAAASVLDDLVNQLAVSGLMVQINGHTDSVGSQSSNVALSKARAEAVKSFLMQNAGSSFPSERVKTRGFGDTVPVADNGTPSGRAKNRRVEVILQSAAE